MAWKYCPRTPDPALLCLPLARLLLHEFVCAHWSLPGSALTKFDWLSLGGGEGRKSHLGPGHYLWALTRGVATQNITSLSPTLQLSSVTVVADPARPQHFGSVFSCS